MTYNYRHMQITERVNSVLKRLDFSIPDHRAAAKDLQKIIEISSYMVDDIADLESRLDFIERQYAGYPPFPLDDFYSDFDDDDETDD